ncbi:MULTISPECIES: hypothetical protein [unclassified Microcoleus]|uniref:hypothetical protein n=1 Tax=unclassified Microcoleus TaxID=2642155 RepID=UPI002FD4A296
MTRKTRNTRQSLTASGWLKPQRWQISKMEAAEALRIPVNRIVKVYPKQHQVIVVYLNKKGQKCSSFFSYRLFARWQQEAIAAIASCRNQQILAPLEVIVQYDLEHFKYPVAIADAIWEALLNHIRHLNREQRLSLACA